MPGALFGKRRSKLTCNKYFMSQYVVQHYGYSVVNFWNMKKNIECRWKLARPLLQNETQSRVFWNFKSNAKSNCDTGIKNLFGNYEV